MHQAPSEFDLSIRAREWLRANQQNFAADPRTANAAAVGANEDFAFVPPEVLRQTMREHGDMVDKRFQDERILYIGAARLMPYAIHKLLENMPMPWEEAKLVDVVYHRTGAITMITDTPKVVEPVFKAQWAATWTALRAEKARRDHFQRVTFPVFDDDEAPLDYALHLQHSVSGEPVQLPLDELDDEHIYNWFYDPLPIAKAKRRELEFGTGCGIRDGHWYVTLPVMSNLYRCAEVLLSDYVDRNYYCYYDYDSFSTAKALGVAFPGCPKFAPPTHEEDPNDPLNADWNEFNDLGRVIFRRVASTEASVAYPYLYGHTTEGVNVATYHLPIELYVRGENILDPAISDGYPSAFHPIKAVQSEYGGVFPGVLDSDWTPAVPLKPKYSDLPLEDPDTHAALQLHWAPPPYRNYLGQCSLSTHVNLIDDWYKERVDINAPGKVKSSYQRLLKRFVLTELEKQKKRSKKELMKKAEEAVGRTGAHDADPVEHEALQDATGDGEDGGKQSGVASVKQLADSSHYDRTRIEWLEAALQLLQQGHATLRLLLKVKNLPYVHVDRNFNAKPTKILTTKERKKSRLGVSFHMLREALMMVKHVVDVHVKFRLGEIDGYQLADALHYIFTHGAKLTGMYRYKYRVMQQIRRCRDIKHLVYSRFNTGDVKRGPGSGFWEPTWKVWVNFFRGISPLLTKWIKNQQTRLFQGRRIKAEAKRVTKQRLDSDFDVNRRAAFRLTLLEALPEGTKESKLKAFEQHVSTAWRAWRSGKDWDGARLGIAPVFIAAISREVKERADEYVRKAQLVRQEIMRGRVIDKTVVKKNLVRLTRLKLRDEMQRQNQYRQHGPVIQPQEAAAVLGQFQSWLHGRGFKRIPFPASGARDQHDIEFLKLALNRLRQQHNVGDRLTQAEREEQKLIEEAFDHPRETLNSIRDALAKNRIFKTVRVEYMDNFDHLYPIYFVDPKEKMVDAFLEQYLWFEASERNLFPCWVQPADRDYYIPPVLVHNWCQGINSVPDIWNTKDGGSVVMLQGELENFYEQVDWKMMEHILKLVVDDRLAEFIVARHNVRMEFNKKDMEYIHHFGLIRGYRFASFLAQLWGLPIDLMLIGGRRASQLAGPPSAPHRLFAHASLQAPHPIKCYQRYNDRIHVLLKYSKREAEELIEKYVAHQGPNFSIEETLQSFQNKRCWPRDARMRLYRNDVLLSKAVIWSFQNRIPPSFCTLSDRDIFASVYSETNPNLLFDMMGFEVRLLPAVKTFLDPQEAENIWKLKNPHNGDVEARAFLQVTPKHVRRIEDEIRKVLMRIGNSAFERIAMKWNSCVMKFIPYYREALLGTPGLQDIFVQGEKKIQLKIMQALNSKMPARFPPVVFYAPPELCGLGMLSVAQSLIPATDKMISRLTDTGIQYFAAGLTSSAGEDVKLPNLFRYFSPWESEIAESTRVWAQVTQMKNEARATNRKLTFDDVEDIINLGIPRISTMFSKDRASLLYDRGILCRQEYQKYQMGRDLKSWWFHDGKHGRLTAGLEEYRKHVIQALGGIEAILQHSLFQGTGFPSWEGFEFNKANSFDEQVKHRNMTKAMRGNLTAVPNRRFALWWSPTINRSNVYTGFKTPIDLTGVFMTGKLVMIQTAIMSLFSGNLWTKIHGGVTCDLANHFGTSLQKEAIDVYDVELVQTHPKKSFTFTNSSADIILQANRRWIVAKPTIITDENAVFMESNVCTKYWIDVQLRWGDYDNHNIAIYARGKFNEYTRDSVTKYPSVTGCVIAIDLAYNCWSGYGYWIPNIQAAIKSAMSRIMKSNPALALLRENMKKAMQLRSTDPTEAHLNTQNFAELFSDQTIWIVDDALVAPRVSERTEEGNTKFHVANGAMQIVNPRTGEMYFSVIHKSAFLGQKRKQKLAREKAAEELATWLHSLPAGERPNKIFLTRKTAFNTMTHTLMEFPNIVIGKSDLNLPIQILVKNHERLMELVASAKESAQFKFNLFDDWRNECEAHTCFKRLLLILRCLHVRPERAWEILDSNRFAKREPHHFWPTLALDQWKLVERQMHDVILTDYGLRMGVDPKKLTAKEVQDIILGQESSSREIQHEEMKQIDQQTKTQLTQAVTATTVNKQGEEIVTKVRATFTVGGVVGKGEWRQKAVQTSELLGSALDRVHPDTVTTDGLILPRDLFKRFVSCADSRVSVVGIMYGPAASPDLPNVREVHCIVMPPQNGGVDYSVCCTFAPTHDMIGENLHQVQPIGWIRVQAQSDEVTPATPTTSDLIRQAKMYAEDSGYAPAELTQVVIGLGRGESVVRGFTYTQQAIEWAISHKDAPHAQESAAEVPAEYYSKKRVGLSGAFSGFTLVPAQGGWNYFFRGNVWPTEQSRYKLILDVAKEFYHPAHRPTHFVGFANAAENAMAEGVDISVLGVEEQTF
jgi:pre-mRNA-processing factor 8